MSDIKNWLSPGKGAAPDDHEEDTADLSAGEVLDGGYSSNSHLSPHTRKALHLDDEEDEQKSSGIGFGLGGGGGGLVDDVLGMLAGYWYYAAAALVVVVVLVVFALKVLGGGGATAPDGSSSAGAQAPASAAAGQAAQQNSPIKDTGVVIEQPVVKGGSYYLRSGQIAWKGKTKNTGDGQELTLEGPTAAMFRQSVDLPHGDITTGVFGRAQPGQPVLHATFQRVTLGSEEMTSGTYYAVDIDSNRVLVAGTYEDERRGDKVIRIYDDRNPNTGSERAYRVSFQAPQGAPIPALIGWQPPALPRADSAGG